MAEPELLGAVLYHREVKGTGIGWIHWITGFLFVGVAIAMMDLSSNREVVFVLAPLLVVSTLSSVWVLTRAKGAMRAVTIDSDSLTIQRLGRNRVIPLRKITSIERDEVPGFTVRYQGGGPGLAAIEQALCTPELDEILIKLGERNGFEVHI